MICTNMLEPLKIPNLQQFLESDFASFELNAQEIRNVVQVVYTLAKTKREHLNGNYLRHFVETFASSLFEL